jgi:HAD superfamily hydrolase (TIGR01509 family)
MNEKKYQALPGVEKFVRGVWRHYPLAICSGALRGEIETMLEGVGLRDCFRTIIAAEDVTVGKPDPQGYLLCMKELSQNVNVALTSQDCLVIEDAPSVIKSVKSVGFQALGVATSHDIAQLGEANWKVNTLDPAEVLKQLPNLKLDI